MRQLTDSERTTMQASMREYHIKRDGLLPSKMRSFKAGFTAGLDHRQAEIDELTFAFNLATEGHAKLTAERDALRAEVSRLRVALQAALEWIEDEYNDGTPGDTRPRRGDIYDLDRITNAAREALGQAGEPESPKGT